MREIFTKKWFEATFIRMLRTGVADRRQLHSACNGCVLPPGYQGPAGSRRGVI